MSNLRRFEVVSKIFGKGIFTLDLEMGWTFDPVIDGQKVFSGLWRILSAGCPAKWHKDQAEDARHPGTGSYILEGDDEDELGEDIAEQPAEPFETPLGKWLTIVTDIGIGAGVLAGDIAASWWSDASFAPPGGGEPLGAVVRRVAPLLDACGEGATTVLVCHQGTILAILMALLGYGLPAARAIALPPGVAVVLRRWADGGSCLDAVVPPTGILRS